MYNCVSVQDHRFPNRFQYLQSLTKLGWNYQEISDGSYTIARSNTSNHINEIQCSDLRSCMALLVACAYLKQSIVINHFEQIHRGYGDISSHLRGLGWKIDEQVIDNNCYVAAIIQSEDGDIALQLRDEKAQIKNPGMYSLFGGSVNPGETYPNALRRELNEELNLDIINIRWLGEYPLNSFVYSLDGVAVVYEVIVKNFDNFQLCEGNSLIVTKNPYGLSKLTSFTHVVITQNFRGLLDDN
jgi:hypothetical protein